MAYLSLRHMEKNNGQLPLFSYYFHRFWRWVNSRHTVLLCSGEICASISMSILKSNVSVLWMKNGRILVKFPQKWKFIFITNGWVWVWVFTRLVKPGNALARGREPWEQPPQGTVTINRLVEYLTTILATAHTTPTQHQNDMQVTML